MASITPPTDEQRARAQARSAKREALRANQRLGRDKRPEGEKKGSRRATLAEDLRFETFRKYWKSAVERAAQRNHRAQFNQRVAPAGWPDYWNDFAMFEAQTYHDYKTNQRIRKAWPSDPLCASNYQWFSGVHGGATGREFE